MVRQMKQMIAQGATRGSKSRLTILSSWINPFMHQPDLQTVWRLDPDKGGLSCCIGDIGTHAFDMVEYVTNQRKRTLADLDYRYPDNAMDVDGTILVRFSDY